MLKAPANLPVSTTSVHCFRSIVDRSSLASPSNKEALVDDGSHMHKEITFKLLDTKWFSCFQHEAAF